MPLDRALPKRLTCLSVSLLQGAIADHAFGCDPPAMVREANPQEVRSYFDGKPMTVLTFLGYSGAGYEDEAAMVAEAARVLDEFAPRDTIVNSGATAEGIGAVYEMAKARGFQTSGIVSAQAKVDAVPLSSCVDVVFYVPDASWGGFVPGTQRLSPTSAAVVEISDVIVAIGGGEIARDELIAAKRSGKEARFIPADMNHRLARKAANTKGLPAPVDFGGAAGALFKPQKG